eukprot:TRINITY_DN3905_c0_g1_i4.p1 TRINITY_DN3905_c0_g1~~TRINITY_DN3905_c0_g1_i4.p1  ORF type:complete len:386 (-),score=84.84 TRINITY_DN3905_c0_g1_i4:441-1598(-)
MEEMITFQDKSFQLKDTNNGGNINGVNIKKTSAVNNNNNFNSPVVLHGLLEIKEDHYCSTNLDDDSADGFLVIQEKAVEPFTEAEWNDILSKGIALKTVNQKKLYASLQLKIPSLLRPRIWSMLADVKSLEKKFKKNYHEIKEKPSKWVDQITKDISRTFPDNQLFKEFNGTEQLFNVLKAYSNFDPEIGYTQGMNFIVAALIIFMSQQKSDKMIRDYLVIDPEFEVNVFWVLVHIMYEKNWRDVMKDGTPRLFKILDVFERKLKSQLPDVYEKIHKHDLNIMCTFSQYFLTLFIYYAPIHFAKRVLDMFLLVGEEILYEIFMKMLTHCREKILSITDTYELHKYLRGGGFIEDVLLKYKDQSDEWIPRARSDSLEIREIQSNRL